MREAHRRGAYDRHLLVDAQDFCHIRFLYGNKCVTVIWPCQEFLCYSIDMPDRPQRFSILTRRLLTAVGNIGQALKEQTAAITKSIEAAKPEQKVPDDVHPVRISGTIETRKNANDAHSGQIYQRLTLLISTLTLIAIIVYAWLTYRQWVEMIGATDAAQDSVHESRLNRQQADKSLKATIDEFRLDQRAWVSVSNVNATAEIGKPLQIILGFTNTGRTPAKDMRVLAVLDPISKGQKVKFAYGKDSYSWTGILQPNAADHVTLFGTRSKTTGEVTPLTSDLSQQIAHGDVAIYADGIVNYQDICGANHWISFCYFLNIKTSGVGVCSEHNDIDENPN